MTGAEAAETLRLVLFGPPGAGKGTQAQLLKERLPIDHISSGDLFRHHLSNGTELGELAREYMNRGALVPDTVTIGMVLDRITTMPEGRGFMLDGFPRNTSQAAALDEALAERGQRIDRVVHIKVADDELIRRLSNRYICRSCQKPFTRDPRSGEAPKRCDDCADGGEIYQRDDDTPDAVANRLAVYHEETTPVLDFYREGGILADIPGESSVETVNGLVLNALGLTAEV
ncbi:MAG: adenylate kinase [Chloroflexota bacterium]|nr:adenylate kinase [Chloroflexota bacterium]MDE2683788.1 adenylate kinase [Chloroflexota bacterium]